MTHKKEAGRSNINSVKSRSGQVICLVQTVIPENINLELVDLKGKTIDSRIETVGSGSHKLVLNRNAGERVTRGAYIVKIKVGGQTSIHRVSVVE